LDYGDSKICTVDPSGSPSDDTPLPQFPNQAEFVIEKFKINHKSNIIPSTELTMTHYLYNYDQNRLVLINHVNGNIDVEHYYYERLKKSIYIIVEIFVVLVILLQKLKQVYIFYSMVKIILILFNKNATTKYQYSIFITIN